MTDREKVIKGLGKLHENCGCVAVHDCDCKTCPYERVNGCCDQIVVDALALLKAQEPNEDWISRKRLRDEIQYYIDEADWGDEVNRVLGWCLEFIDNQEGVKWE